MEATMLIPFLLETKKWIGHLKDIEYACKNIKTLTTLGNEKTVELSNQEQLNQLFSHINLQVNELSNNLSAKLTLNAYANDEKDIQDAIDHIHLLTFANQKLPAYQIDFWDSKADKLKKSIRHYLRGINGTNLSGGDILVALANQTEFVAKEFYEAVQPYFALIMGGILAYEFYAELGQPPRGDGAQQLFWDDYETANKRTEELTRKYLTDFTTVEANVKLIIEKNKSLNLSDKTTEIFTFLNNKYSSVDSNPSLPTVRWLVISCAGGRFDPQNEAHLRCLGKTEDNKEGKCSELHTSNCPEHKFISTSREGYFIFPFVDTYTNAVNETTAMEIESLLKKHSTTYLFFFKVDTVTSGGGASDLLKVVPQPYRSLVIERTFTEIELPDDGNSHPVVGHHYRADIKVLKSESLPLYQKEIGQYEFFVF